MNTTDWRVPDSPVSRAIPSLSAPPTLSMSLVTAIGNEACPNHNVTAPLARSFQIDEQIVKLLEHACAAARLNTG